MLLPIPEDLKKILNQKERPVPDYNVFTLVMELISAYYIERQVQLGENWISLFKIIDQLNKLETEIYSHVLMAIENKDRALISSTMGNSALFFNDSLIFSRQSTK